MRISDLAGPMVHARQALGAEPVLWAAFMSYHHFDIRGLQLDGKPKHNIALRALDSVAAAATDTQDDGPGHGPTEMLVFGKNQKCAAMRFGAVLIERGEQHLWALTPHRLHVARVVEPPPPKQGFIKSMASVLASRERTQVHARRTEPVFDVPRGEIAGLEVAKRHRKPCLRLSFADGSGFDLFFGVNRLGLDTEPDQYERLLALSQGRHDQWA